MSNKPTPNFADKLKGKEASESGKKPDETPEVFDPKKTKVPPEVEKKEKADREKEKEEAKKALDIEGMGGDPDKIDTPEEIEAAQKRLEEAAKGKQEEKEVRQEKKNKPKERTEKPAPKIPEIPPLPPEMAEQVSEWEAEYQERISDLYDVESLADVEGISDETKERIKRDILLDHINNGGNKVGKRLRKMLDLKKDETLEWEDLTREQKDKLLAGSGLEKVAALPLKTRKELADPKKTNLADLRTKVGEIEGLTDEQKDFLKEFPEAQLRAVMSVGDFSFIEGMTPAHLKKWKENGLTGNLTPSLEKKMKESGFLDAFTAIQTQELDDLLGKVPIKDLKHIPDSVKLDLVTGKIDELDNATIELKEDIAEMSRGVPLDENGNPTDDPAKQRAWAAKQTQKLGVSPEKLNAGFGSSEKLSPLMKILAKILAPIAIALGSNPEYWQQFMNGTGDGGRGTNESRWRAGNLRGGPAQLSERHRQKHADVLKDPSNYEMDPRYANNINWAVSRIMPKMETYKQVAVQANVPWELIAAIHYRESSLNFGTYLHQGDRLGSPAKRVPKNIPVFHEWAPAAIHALGMKGSLGMNEMRNMGDLARSAAYAEKYNGMGYANKGRTSPYVWAGTKEYRGGMYVRDHVYSANAYDKRPGVMPIVFELMRRQGKQVPPPGLSQVA